MEREYNEIFVFARAQGCYELMSFPDTPDNTSPFPYVPPSRLGKLWWHLVRFGFRLLYSEMAWTYDLVAWVVSFGQWWTWQRAALDFLNVEKGDFVLEIAHGTGSLQIDMDKLGYRRVALDYSPYMGRIARRKLHKKGITAPFLRAKAQALPLPNSAFDAIVSTFPTPFIIELETLQEANRVLKSGGRFVIVVNAVLTKGGVAKEALEAAYRVTGQRGEWNGSLQERFATAGFQLEPQTVQKERSMVQVLVATKLSE